MSNWNSSLQYHAVTLVSYIQKKSHLDIYWLFLPSTSFPIDSVFTLDTVVWCRGRTHLHVWDTIQYHRWGCIKLVCKPPVQKKKKDKPIGPLVNSGSECPCPSVEHTHAQRNPRYCCARCQHWPSGRVSNLNIYHELPTSLFGLWWSQKWFMCTWALLLPRLICTVPEYTGTMPDTTFLSRLG